MEQVREITCIRDGHFRRWWTGICCTVELHQVDAAVKYVEQVLSPADPWSKLPTSLASLHFFPFM